MFPPAVAAWIAPPARRMKISPPAVSVQHSPPAFSTRILPPPEKQRSAPVTIPTSISPPAVRSSALPRMPSTGFSRPQIASADSRPGPSLDAAAQRLDACLTQRARHGQSEQFHAQGRPHRNPHAQEGPITLDSPTSLRPRAAMTRPREHRAPARGPSACRPPSRSRRLALRRCPRFPLAGVPGNAAATVPLMVLTQNAPSRVKPPSFCATAKPAADRQQDRTIGKLLHS